MNEGRWNVQCLQEVVLVAEEASQNVLQPSQTWIVQHVLRNVAVIRSHEWDLPVSSVLNQMQHSAVWTRDVDQRWFKLRNLLLDTLAKRET